MELEVKNDLMPVEQKSSVELTRTIEEVRGAIIVAKKFPRNEIDAITKIKKSCQRLSLAKKALYSYPRGTDENGKKNVVSGPSINLARTIASHWGNIKTSVRECERGDDYSIVEVSAWDMESNTNFSTSFTVMHVRDTKKGRFPLKDQRDISELILNQASRKLRGCILNLIPNDVIEDAVNTCKLTQERGDSMPITEKISALVLAFERIGVNRKMIEVYLNHKIELMTNEEGVELQGILLSIQDGANKREDYFNTNKIDDNDTQETLNNL